MIVKVTLVEHDFVGQKGYSLLKIQTNICIFDEKMETNLVWLPERHCRILKSLFVNTTY